MSEIMQDLGKLLLAGLVALAILGVLRDAGLTGFSTAELSTSIYDGPEKFFVQENGRLTLDLNTYFSGKNLQYFVEAPSGLGIQLIKNILWIAPERAGDYELTVHASNFQKIEQQKLIIKVIGSEPNRNSCSCQH